MYSVYNADLLGKESRMPIRYSKNGRIATITLEWSDGSAILDDAMAYDLIGHCEKASEDAEILAVVLTGSGANFCFGQLESDPPAEDAFLGEVQEPATAAVQALAAINVPVIAAIN